MLKDKKGGEKLPFTVKKSNAITISMILVILAVIFMIGIDDVSAAQDVNISSYNSNLSSDSLALNSSTQAIDSQNNQPATQNTNTSESNQSSSLESKNNQNSPDPQIYRNGVPVARGGYPAGHVFSSIQEAINAAQSGDTIMLEDGTVFYERITVDKALTFDVFNNGHATVDGSSGGRVVTITVTSGTVTFNDITFTHGSVNGNGGAIYNNNAGTTLSLNNCDFTSNTVSRTTGNTDVYGGAIYSTGTLNITNCNFTSNTAVSGSNNEGYGGAIYCTGTSTLTGSTFTSNSVNSASGTQTDDGGAIYNTGRLTVNNCNFTSNSASRNGGAIWSDSNLSGVTLNVTGSNLESNTAASGGAIYNDDGNAEIHFNRIIGNIPTGSQIRRPNGGGSVNIVNNWWGDNAGSTGKVSGTMTATTWLVLTVTAAPTSIPTSGNSTVTADLTHDQNGNYYNPASGHVPDGITVTFTGTLGSVDPVSATTLNGIATTMFTGSNSGIATVNATIDGVNVGTTITVGSDIYVSDTRGNDTTGDGSYANPYKTIAKGISMVFPGGTVHIENGTYSGTGNVNITINSNITVAGESRDSTIVNGQNVNRIFIIPSGYTVTISNLTLTNGLASNSNGGAIQNNGGTLTVNNCAFTNNRASRTGSTDTTDIYGGAIYNTGTLTINGSIFTSNTAVSGQRNDAFGGAIYSTGSLIVTNSAFTSNSVSSSSGTATDDGGAIAVYGSLTVTNSTFTSNTATDDGGAICIGNESTSGMNVTITNSTFTSNHASYGGAIWNNGGTSTNPEIITGSTFTSNSAAYGGVIRNWGILTITNSNFTSNTGTYGGAINNNQNSAVLTVTGSNFTGNSATYGGAFYNTLGTAEIHFNRIVGNTGTDVYRSAGTVNAQNNWWGNNFQGSNPLTAGRINTGINAATWLVLNITASPNTILVGGTSTVTADLTHDQNGNYYNPSSGHVPDGIPVSFTGTLGSVNPGSATTVNGISTTTFTAGYVPGTATVNATVDGVTVSTQIIINPVASLEITQTVNTPVNVGNSVTFIVTVRNNGPNTATNINIQDIIPARLTGITVTPSVGTYSNGIWNIPSLANGTTATLNITGTVTASMAGLTTNNTATELNQTEYTPQLPSSTTGVYTKLANVTITNAANSGSLNVGQTGIFTITVTNNGPDAANNIIINDVLPSGFTASTTGGTYDGSVWTISSLASGDSVTLTFTGALTSAMAGTDIVNHATETQTEYPQTITIPDVTIHVKKADVVLSQTANSPVNVGNTVTYTVTATNHGPDTATNIVISDVVPAGLTNVTVTPSVGTYNNGVWTIPSLTNGAFATLTINGIAGNSMAGLNTTNTATQTGQTEYSDQFTTATAKVYTTSVDIAVSHNSWYPDLYTYNYGASPVFTVRATNNGPDEATGVILEYKIGNGFQYITCNPYQGTATYDPNTNTITWNIGYMPISGRTYLYIYLKVIETGNNTANLTNNATLKHVDQYDRSSGNNQVSRSIYVPSAADVQINQTMEQTSPNQATITITATNNGPNIANAIQVADTLPSGLTNITVTPSVGTYSNGIWTIPTLANGTTATLTITATINQTTGTIKNTATKTTQTEVDWNLNNNAQTCILTLSGNYTKSVDVAVSHNSWYPDLYTYNYGASPVFTVRATNNGPDEATGVILEYKIGNGFQYITCNPYQGTISYDPDTNTITWNIGYMPVGGRTYLYIYLKVIETGNNTANLTNNATLKHVDQYDRSSGNNQVSRSIYVPSAADVQINQTLQQTGPHQITITITATNNGPNTANAIQVADTLPSQLTNLTIVPSVGTYSNGIWTIPTLADKETATLVIQGTINQLTGTIKNTATKTTQTEVDWNLNNNAQTVYI